MNKRARRDKALGNQTTLIALKAKVQRTRFTTLKPSNAGAERRIFSGSMKVISHFRDVNRQIYLEACPAHGSEYNCAPKLCRWRDSTSTNNECQRCQNVSIYLYLSLI